MDGYGVGATCTEQPEVKGGSVNKGGEGLPGSLAIMMEPAGKDLEAVAGVSTFSKDGVNGVLGGCA